MSDKEFDTSELLSGLEKLKAKYSFNLDDEIPEDADYPETKEPVIKVPEEKEEPVQVVTKQEVAVEEETPVQPETPVVEDTPAKEISSTGKDMSWLIDSDDTPAAPTVVETPQPVVKEEPVVPQAEAEAEPVQEKEDDDTNWFLIPPETSDDVEEEPEEQPAEEISVEEPVTVATSVAVIGDDEENDFSDLDGDDDLKVIRDNEPSKEESPFYAAFVQANNEENKKVKPPKPVKSAKPAKAPKEPKEPKVKKDKSVKNGSGKSKKKVILNVVVAVALAVAVWACVFVTDIVLVSNWYSPVFCAESESFDDGSKTYIGAFYKMQVSVDETGKIQRVCLPWFFDGPNDSK